MRILFLSGHYPPDTKGGGELSTHYLAQGLRELGEDITVITASTRVRQEDVVDGVPVIRLPIPFQAKPLFEKTWATKAALLLDEELKKHASFDLVHCHDFRTAQVVSMLALPNTVVTVRDYAFICGSPNNLLADGTRCPGCEKLGTVIKNRAVIEAPLLRKAARIWQYWHNIEFRKNSLRAFKNQVYISKAQQHIIAERLPDMKEHIQVIYNPVPPHYISTQPTRPVAKTILYAGTVDSYKGVGLLLEAFRQLVATHSEVQLKIVGEGPQRKIYEEQVARAGLQYKISFARRLTPERMMVAYDEAYLVVAPHVWDEPFGRTIIEAMARERVVVAANAGGPAEIIQNGVTGFLFEQGSVESLVHTLETALSAAEIDRREMQRAARLWVTKHLSPTTIARQYQEFYQGLVSE